MLRWTQEHLAEKADVSVDTIKRIERGNHGRIQLRLAFDIACALGISLGRLLPAQSASSPDQLLDEAEEFIRAAREKMKK